MDKAHRKANRLIDEKSPYLLQHACNPVDWYPWGEAAFVKAKGENKPIFLSIGYSTCHWCHVMERESFEDEEVAAALNRDYVAIKVDREERPDIDHIYMEFCQKLTGQGGWPLTIIMAPDKTPFFAGTYFPKNSKWGRPGLLDILAHIRRQWKDHQDELVEHGRETLGDLPTSRDPSEQQTLTNETLEKAATQLQSSFDRQYGGFGGAPKFPIPHNLFFLLRYWYRTRQEDARKMVLRTLEAMHAGGIYDHIGYGFARYSTDVRWLVPHFEKMLYDNALLCCAYLEGYQCTGKREFAAVAEEILTYALRDMTNAEGAFYSAEDADSEGVEGKFYVWTPAEIVSVLGEKDGAVFADYYGVTEKGNFEHGSSILNTTHRDMADFAQKRGIPEAQLQEQLKEGRNRLFAVRKKRVPPFKDDKILTAWNALMIVALLKASRVLGCADYLHAAVRVLGFLERNLVRSDGRLLARYRDGEASFPAYLDDYAFLLWALIEAYETTFDADYLTRAGKLAADMERLFWDESAGGFFFYGKDSEALPSRPKEIYDGAIPSGNSVAAYALIKLARITGEERPAELAQRILGVFASEVVQYPAAYTFFLMALELHLAPPRHIVVAGPRAHAETQALLSVLKQKFLPDATMIFRDPDEPSRQPLTDLQPIGGKPTAYVCENFACQAPATDAVALERLLEAK